MKIASTSRWLRKAGTFIIGAAFAGALIANAGSVAARTPATTAGQTMYLLADGSRLIKISSAAPDQQLDRARITGLQPAETLLGIDFRPANGKLYGLGSSNRLYVIDPGSGAATQVGSGTFAIPLKGSRFGFDFNPTVDRIRVVSDAGQNLRLHPDLGTVVDADLNTPGIQIDGNLAYSTTTNDPNAGRTPRVTAAGYTNPDNDPATGTTLYDIDAAQDVLTTQAPPNAGTLNTTGSLGMDIGSAGGFDISPANVGYAAVDAGGRISALVMVNLTTGTLTPLGVIKADRINGLAIPTQP